MPPLTLDEPLQAWQQDFGNHSNSVRHLAQPAVPHQHARPRHRCVWCGDAHTCPGRCRLQAADMKAWILRYMEEQGGGGGGQVRGCGRRGSACEQEEGLRGLANDQLMMGSGLILPWPWPRTSAWGARTARSRCRFTSTRPYMRARPHIPRVAGHGRASSAPHTLQRRITHRAGCLVARGPAASAPHRAGARRRAASRAAMTAAAATAGMAATATGMAPPPPPPLRIGSSGPTQGRLRAARPSVRARGSRRRCGASSWRRSG